MAIVCETPDQARVTHLDVNLAIAPDVTATHPRNLVHLRYVSGACCAPIGCEKPGGAWRTVLGCEFAADTYGRAPPLHAQHASDDPVASATDAFGLTLGLESIGMYNSTGVRGFNPQTAGNVRIEGLYFDQQGALSDRVVEGSTVRIGVSEIGYAFPAPTGIVDYDLRRPGNGTLGGTVVASAGPFQAHGLSIDGTLPLMGGELQLPLGGSYQLSTQTAGVANPGYTSSVANFGATPQWRPNEWLTFRGIVDWTQTTNAKTLPTIFTGGDFLPPETPRGYYGQNWAEGRSLSENYGGIVTATLSTHWSFVAGLFRSIADNPISYADLYLNTQRNGSAEQFVVGNPDQWTGSTSGEARLTGRFTTGTWRHSIAPISARIRMIKRVCAWAWVSRCRTACRSSVGTRRRLVVLLLQISLLVGHSAGASRVDPG